MRGNSIVVLYRKEFHLNMGCPVMYVVLCVQTTIQFLPENKLVMAIFFVISAVLNIIHTRLLSSPKKGCLSVPLLFDFLPKGIMVEDDQARHILFLLLYLLLLR